MTKYIMNKIITNYWPILLVALSVGFNLLMLFPETQIKMDLNDSVFAFVLINHIDKLLTEILHHPLSIIHLPLLLDHWVPEFSMGFPVFSYYQHFPHLTVVLIYRLLSLITPISQITLMVTFNWLKYLMLSFFPLVIYYSARKFDLSKIASVGAALVSTLISTQYLYGTDYNALVFRGSGMYTQLWGIFFLPLSLSAIYDSLKNNRGYLKSVILLVLTLNGHLVFGYIAVLSAPLLLLSLIMSRSDLTVAGFKSEFINKSKRPLLILTSSFLLLSYWFIPLILNSAYQNKSLWDDLTKFNSYGYLQILKWLVSGQLFDNGRFPVLTILIAMGFFYSLYTIFSNSNWRVTRAGSDQFSRNYTEGVSQKTASRDGARQDPLRIFFPLLFLFWLVLYFGRYTFGPLFDLLPMTESLHGHRLINGIHFAGIFLVGLSLEWLVLTLYQKIKNRFLFLITLISLIALILSPAIKERYDYLKFNNYSVKVNTALFNQESSDFARILAKIKELGPARINIGRPGNWGRNFYVGAFSGYFVATVNNFDVIGFEPESWSPTTDIEQFFSEYDPAYYNLFNIGYIIAPPEEKFATVPFAKKILQSGKFVLYKVNTSGLAQNNLSNFDFINSDLLIYTDKNIKSSLDRLWIGSKLMPSRNHPTIVYSFSNLYPAKPRSAGRSGANFLTMLDLANYKLGKPDENREILNLFGQNPFGPLNFETFKLNFNLATPSGTVLSEKKASNYFAAIVETPQDSILMLKASFHPFWQASIDGKKINKFMVEPSFMAVNVPSGKHEVEFKYFPAGYKVVLILFGLLVLPGLYFLLRRYKNLLS